MTKPSKFEEYFKIGHPICNPGIGFGGYIKDMDDGGIYIVDRDGDIFYMSWGPALFAGGPTIAQKVAKDFKEAEAPDLEKHVL
jgi:hypothetical protein